jgi:sortase A
MMELMSGSGSHQMNRRVVHTTVSVAALISLLGACSGSSEPAAEAATPSTTLAPTTTVAPTTTTTVATTTTTVAPATTTTVAPTTTTSTTTTTTPVEWVPNPPTTIAASQPVQPIAPPSDTYAAEPVIDMGSISIPKLGVEMTMYEGIRLSTLDYGPGHWPGTAEPGETGNVVVGGHRTSKHRVFRDVDQLVPGDEIIFSDAAGQHTYLVNRVEVVEPTAMWIVEPTDTPTATLFACHPPGSTAQRIIVFADLST